MATNTTNFDLKKPAYTDTADIADINGNMDKVDASLNGLADAIAIVAKNNTHAAITAGQYVYVHGHGSLAEGLYTAKSNIAANATLSTSNLQADGSGGLNALNSKIASVNITSGSILDTIIAHDRTVMPWSFTKSGAGSISDAPSDVSTSEFVCWVVGHGDRLIAFLTRYGSSLAKAYRRRIFQNAWSDNDWTVFNN